jgi:hypothetical protein
MNTGCATWEETVYHYDPKTALDELRDEGVLPQVVHLRDIILRTRLDAKAALDLNREFQEYLSLYGELNKLGQQILEKLAADSPKNG